VGCFGKSDMVENYRPHKALTLQVSLIELPGGSHLMSGAGKTQGPICLLKQNRN
jgi:hypothetical protein